DDDGLVHPFSAGVAQVGPDRWPGGYAAAARDARFDEQPRAVADRRDWLAGLEEGAHEVDRLLVESKIVGIHLPARKDERIEVVSACAVDVQVHVERVAPLRVVPSLHALALRGYDHRLGARIAQRLHGRGHLDLFETVVDENRDTPAIQLLRHLCLLAAMVYREAGARGVQLRATGEAARTQCQSAMAGVPVSAWA